MNQLIQEYKKNRKELKDRIFRNKEKGSEPLRDALSGYYI